MKAKSAFAPIFIFLGAIWMAGCAASTPELIKKDKPSLKSVVVLPISNYTNDIVAPEIIRYLCGRELKKLDFSRAVDDRKADQLLRQIGITQANQINDNNLREIGQIFKTDCVFYGILHQYRQELIRQRIIVEGRLLLLELKTGRVLWERHIVLRKEGMQKLPLPERANYEWTDEEIKDMANHKAAKPLKDFVVECMDTLSSPKQLLKAFYRQDD